MSAHDHAHHEGGGHAHGVSADSDARWLLIALLINLGFMLVEVAVGIAANSLALLTRRGAHAHGRRRDRARDPRAAARRSARRRARSRSA